MTDALPKRVLFVDDEPSLLDGLRCRMRPFRHEWDTVFACGGESACEEIDKRRFDLVVSDVRMPGIDGLGVMTHLRERQPSAFRVVLSGETETETGGRIAGIAHQFLSKPCEAGRLEAAIDRAFRVQELLPHGETRERLTNVTRLPVSRQGIRRLKALLGHGPTTLADLAAAVCDDASIAAQVLRLANTSFFTRPDPIGNLDEAVKYLGVEVIGSLIREAEPCDDVDTADSVFSLQAVNRHGRLAARIAERVAAEAPLLVGAFAGGLLHDFGEWVLAAHFPARLERALAESMARDVPLEAVEAETFGATHAEIGAYLLGVWGLPLTIVDAVAGHHRTPDPGPRGLDVRGAIQISAAVVDEIEARDAQKSTRCARTDALAASVGVGARLAEWRAEASRDLVSQT